MRIGICLVATALATAAMVASPTERAGQADGGPTGTVTGTVTIDDGGESKADRSGIAVYLEGVAEPAPTPQKKEMRQKNLTFTPGVMIIVKGTTVDFPNDDKVFHNVFSLSKAGRFDLGLYKAGDTRSVTFKEAGVIDIYCNIHPQMAAKIKVLDTSFYAVTGADGTFKIKNVPPGKYPIVGWQPYGQEYRGEVVVPPGATASTTISLVLGKGPKTHLRKDGTPYGRYK